MRSISLHRALQGLGALSAISVLLAWALCKAHPLRR